MDVKLLDNQTIGIFMGQYDPRLLQLIKSLPGRMFEPKAKLWYIAADGLALSSVERLAKAGFLVDTKVKDLLLSSVEEAQAKFETKLPLYPYQKDVAAFMAASGSCLNACFVGAGKTLTCLAVTEYLQARRTLIVVPKSVLLQWATIEIPKWLPNAPVMPILGSQAERSAAYRKLGANNHPYYVVIGYDTLRNDIGQLIPLPWDVIVCDEAHRLASIKTQTYQAIARIKAKHRYALTATPIMNRSEDMYGLINWIRPGALGNYYSFINRYTIKGGFKDKQIVGNQRTEELAARVAPFIIRRTLEEVGLQLPEKVEVDIPIKLSPTEQALYDQIRANLLLEIDRLLISKVDNPEALQMTIVKIGKLFELCDSMQLIGDSTESSKLEALKEHLEGTLIDGQKAIIITRFSRMAEILQRELNQLQPLLITGATSDRQAILTRFEKDPYKKILIGTEAISQGLNLQVANVLYNYDLPWNHARMEQRIGRIHRQGQEKPVFVYNLITMTQVEKWLKRKIEMKKQLSASLLPRSFAELKEMLE